MSSKVKAVSVLSMTILIAVIVAISLYAYRPEGETIDYNNLFTVGNVKVGQNKNLTVVVEDNDWWVDYDLSDSTLDRYSDVVIATFNNDFNLKIITPKGTEYIRTKKYFFLGEGKREIFVRKGDKIISHNIITIVPPVRWRKW